jgi:hypothetical protein
MAQLLRLIKTDAGADVTFQCSKEEVAHLGNLLNADIDLTSPGIRIEDCKTLIEVLYQFYEYGICDTCKAWSPDPFYAAQHNAERLHQRLIDMNLKTPSKNEPTAKER